MKRATENQKRSSSPRAEAHGVVIVDKERGPTSHDVVHRIRKALGEKRVGHAGTLDPMASGVLVVLVGEATKLSPYLTAHDKQYETIVALGEGTDTLDAEGRVVSSLPLGSELSAELLSVHAAPHPMSDNEVKAAAPRLFAAMEAERRRTSQVPPAYSAIKVGGQKSYDLAREGEEVEHAPRPVRVHSLELVPREGAGGHAHLRFRMNVSKGYYVRSFARDFAAHLGTYAHLVMLRRTRSGPFGLERAVSSDAAPADLLKALIPLDEAIALGLPTAELTPLGAKKAMDGKRLLPSDFTGAPPEMNEPFAWMDAEGRGVALGHRDGEQFRVDRGFARPPASAKASEPSLDSGVEKSSPPGK